MAHDGTAQLERIGAQLCVASDVVIVVPCFNESVRLSPEAFERFAALEPAVRFVFVDDGSADGTRALLTRLCARRPDRLSLIALAQNAGQGEAVREGISHA